MTMAKNQPINQFNQADSDLLSAYLDKQLSREAHQSLDQRLERETEFACRTERFTRNGGAAART